MRKIHTHKNIWRVYSAMLNPKYICIWSQQCIKCKCIFGNTVRWFFEIKVRTLLEKKELRELSFLVCWRFATQSECAENSIKTKYSHSAICDFATQSHFTIYCFWFARVKVIEQSYHIIPLEHGGKGQLRTIVQYLYEIIYQGDRSPKRSSHYGKSTHPSFQLFHPINLGPHRPTLSISFARTLNSSGNCPANRVFSWNHTIMLSAVYRRSPRLSANSICKWTWVTFRYIHRQQQQHRKQMVWITNWIKPPLWLITPRMIKSQCLISTILGASIITLTVSWITFYLLFIPFLFLLYSFSRTRRTSPC